MKKTFWQLYAVGVLIYIFLLFSWCKCSAQPSALVRVAHDSFISYYDVSTHNPALVVYELKPEHFAGVLKAKGRHFKMDTKLPKPRVKDSDYSGTGYVRGHLCSAADRDSKSSWLKETYLTSNLVPMTMVCNSGRWKVVEDSCRLLATSGHPLKVVRLPLYSENPDRILSRITIMVPDAFLCLAMCLAHGDCHTYLVRNTNVLQYVVHASGRGVFQRNETISILLQNILGLWSREEYETITR